MAPRNNSRSKPAPEPTAPVVEEPTEVTEEPTEVTEEESLVSSLEEVVEEPTEVTEEPTEVPTSEDLVKRQEEAEEAVLDEVVDDSTHQVTFQRPHTFGGRVYLEGETADVPKNHPFYGMSAQDQEITYGVIHFLPVK